MNETKSSLLDSSEDDVEFTTTESMMENTVSGLSAFENETGSIRVTLILHVKYGL